MLVYFFFAFFKLIFLCVTFSLHRFVRRAGALFLHLFFLFSKHVDNNLLVTLLKSYLLLDLLVFFKETVHNLRKHQVHRDERAKHYDKDEEERPNCAVCGILVDVHVH